MNCNHHYEQIVWIGKDNKVYVKCTNCEIIIQPTVNYNLLFPKDYKPKLSLISEIIRKITNYRFSINW